MRELKLNNDIFLLPENWNEISANDLLSIAHLLIITKNPVDFKTKLFLRITGLQVCRVAEHVIDEKCYIMLKKGDKRYMVSTTDLSFVIDVLDFLFLKVTDKDGNIDYLVDSKIIKNLLPVIQHDFIKYYGPADALTNILFEEYIFCETYYQNYIKTNKESDLDMLIAVMYRKKDATADKISTHFRGDLREPFNSFLIEANAKKLKSLNAAEKKAIYLFYYGCRSYIIKKFDIVFNSKKETAADNVSTFESMMKLVNALSQNDVTKNEQVRKSMLYEVLITLQEIALQNKRLEESLKK